MTFRFGDDALGDGLPAEFCHGVAELNAGERVTGCELPNRPEPVELAEGVERTVDSRAEADGASRAMAGFDRLKDGLDRVTGVCDDLDAEAPGRGDSTPVLELTVPGIRARGLSTLRVPEAFGELACCPITVTELRPLLGLLSR